MAHPPKGRFVDRAKHRVFLRRAQELIQAMDAAIEKGHRMAAGIAGVHAAIACGDAVTVAFMGQRSGSESHAESARLLARSGATGATDHAQQLGKVVALKTPLEYDDREPTLREVRDLVERVHRLHRWAKELQRNEP